MSLSDEIFECEPNEEYLHLDIEKVKKSIQELKEEIDKWQNDINEYKKKHWLAEHLTDTSVYKLKEKILIKVFGEKLCVEDNLDEVCECGHKFREHAFRYIKGQTPKVGGCKIIVKKRETYEVKCQCKKFVKQNKGVQNG